MPIGLDEKGKQIPEKLVNKKGESVNKAGQRIDEAGEVIKTAKKE